MGTGTRFVGDLHSLACSLERCKGAFFRTGIVIVAIGGDEPFSAETKRRGEKEENE